MARRKETPKRRARWEWMRARVLSRMFAYSWSRNRDGEGHRAAQREVSEAVPFDFCADCGELCERTGHMGCQYPGSALALPFGKR
ncbi:MAG: hypothetical protein HYZ29_23240 [Myxococcales bacterium]|nr:hypothetical protein [Myxococcales bacterium]